MPSFFSYQSKAGRIAVYLRAQLSVYHQTSECDFKRVLENQSFEGSELPFSEERQKQHLISQWVVQQLWEPKVASTDINLAYPDIEKRYLDHKTCLGYADDILTELGRERPNYHKLLELAYEIRNTLRTTRFLLRIETVLGEPSLKFSEGFSGSDVSTDFMIGFMSPFIMLVQLVTGIVCAPFYYFGSSEHYYGSPQFFVDLTINFLDSLCKGICAIIFPLAMLRSKYETDSFNIFKGELERSLEGIISLVESELSNGEIDEHGAQLS